VVQALREGTEGEMRAAGMERRMALEDRYELLSSYRMNAMGLMRYLRGQDSAASRSATS